MAGIAPAIYKGMTTTKDLNRNDNGYEYHGRQIFVPVSLGDEFTLDTFNGESFATLRDAMVAIDEAA